MDKKCFKCGKVKDISEFYTHPRMADGHLGKCKSCTKKDVSKRYHSEEGIKKIMAYEKWRSRQEYRKENKTEYQRTTRKNSPGKYKAWKMTSNAVRDGRITKKPCEVCGSKQSEAHHPDYRRWRKIIWLCRNHHMQVHNRKEWKNV